MARPRRSQAIDSEFNDPLSNHDSPTLRDPLERALHNESASAIMAQPVVTVESNTTVEHAMQKMTTHGVSCVLVVKGGKIVGTFSERIIVNYVAHRFYESRNYPVERYMRRIPAVVYETDSAGTALGVIAIGGLRHVPILDVNNRALGVTCPVRIMGFLRKYFATETKSNDQSIQESNQ